ncbi:NAD-dependent epimerase/dehydratase family protein [Patulibacter sp. S7RM1-6]
MPLALVTGSGGLIGSASVEHFVRRGFDVVGIENDMRSRFFGPEASTARTTARLERDLAGSFRTVDMDIRNADGVRRLVRELAAELELVIHTAAQPSHDWAASDAIADFTVNANGTLNLLEAVRHEKPEATFVHMSTNKVYGDRPNFLPLIETDTRLELPEDHEFYGGIDTSMSIDRTMHSVFGASKVAADVMVQEYGRYFDMPTVCFRGGCLTGPAHAGAKLHGFLSYLMKCTVTGMPYTIFGYGGKQVRDNIHAADVVKAFDLFHAAPTTSAVYNLGGGRGSNVSMLEAIALCEEIAGKELDYTLSDENRAGDHRWYISDFSDFGARYPEFRLEHGIREVLQEIHDVNVELWVA